MVVAPDQVTEEELPPGAAKAGAAKAIKKSRVVITANILLGIFIKKTSLTFDAFIVREIS